VFVSRAGSLAYGHGHVQAHRPDRSQSRRKLGAVLALTAAVTVAEVIGGILTGSLALLADAGHMLSDNVALAIALGASWLADRPPTPNRSFGYQRAEILAALVNGIALVAIAVWIFAEAASRLGDPPEIAGGWMLGVALAGLAVNIVAASVLWGGRAESLNVSAAFRHVLADLLGSIGVIAAAIVILASGWLYADPLISALIGALILFSAWPILRDAGRVLLEASPAGIDAREVGQAMAAADGVVEVHDLHLWEVTTGFPALSAHLLVADDDDCHARRHEVEAMLQERFGITHTTLQVDHAQPRLLELGGADAG
jgi:cobalt-zinc-cadmium efflux system protein